jgi:hypothetical protein
MDAPNIVEIRTPSHAIMSQRRRNNKIIRNGAIFSKVERPTVNFERRQGRVIIRFPTAPKKGRVNLH